MRALALVAGNFLREQRWVLFALTLYSGGMAAVIALLGGSPSRSDLVFYAQQQGTLGLLFGVFLVSAAIHNDQRSRRLLLILSKAVSRCQYLAALVLGSVSVSAAFILLALIALFGVPQRLPPNVELGLLLPFLPLAVLVVCLGLCFSTFLHPFFANAITLLVFGSSFVVAPHLHGTNLFFLPGAALLLPLEQRAAAEVPASVFIVLLQSAIAFVLACRIFSRRDLGSSVE